MRTILDLNNNWYYQPYYDAGLEYGSLQGFELVNLPHTNLELPYNYFDETSYQFTSCYKYPLVIPPEFRGQIMILHFEGVMATARVFLNQTLLGEHQGGYTPFEVRIDPMYDFENPANILTVVVDSAEAAAIPPFGGQIDYLTYGGIYREVSLGIYDPIYISNIKVEPTNVLDAEPNVKVKVYLTNPTKLHGIGQFQITLRDFQDSVVVSVAYSAQLDATTDQVKFQLTGLTGIQLWDLEQPVLYSLEVEFNIDGYSDRHTEHFGFRHAQFKADGFFLNGKRLKLRGLNRHQSYPYVGYAMPQRVQEKDATILKRELRLNIVRTSHYPQSRHFLNKCDELGLLVFEEIPGWQHIGDQAWQKIAQTNVREMITRDWNHPSIILWGVRINESPDDHVFYTATNAIARGLDPTRQTGGVRCITASEFLEDVYTFNDFNHDGIQKPLREQTEVTGLPRLVPYLVTEFNGHMYPTKRFDQEERQHEHALRHVRVQNAAAMDDHISGAIGWCAFDYNTHKDFGSGDRICYHGVMDMFRLPKFASYLYASQVSPQVQPVLEPVTFWARGERDQCRVFPLLIFTNCDYLKFQYGSVALDTKIFPRQAEYPGLPYPPAIIDFSVIPPEQVGAWGMQWEDAVIRGYYQDELVIEKRLCRNPLPSQFWVKTDDLRLSAAQKDATRIVLKILDQYGNLLPFCDEIVLIELKGPGRLQGPAEIVVKGGAIAFWVETLNQPGLIEVLIHSRQLGTKTVKIEVT
jgi:beta-galactosidase